MSGAPEAASRKGGLDLPPWLGCKGGRRQREQGQAQRGWQRPTEGIQRQQTAETPSERGRRVRWKKTGAGQSLGDH